MKRGLQKRPTEEEPVDASHTHSTHMLSQDAVSAGLRSLFAKELLEIGLFCGK